MYSDTLRSAHQKKSCGSPSQQSTVKHNRKKSPRKKKRHQQCGMVLPRQPFGSRRGGLVHYSQPTLSSTARSRPSVRHSIHIPPQARDRKYAEHTVNSKGSRRRARQGRVRDLKTAISLIAAMQEDGVGGGEGADEDGGGSKDEGRSQTGEGSSQSETETLTVAPQLTKRASPSNISPPPLLLRRSACPNSPSSPALSESLQNTVQECQR